MNPFLKKLLEERGVHQAAIDALIEGAEAEQRSSFTPEEEAQLNDLFDKTKAIDARIAELEDAEAREQHAAEIAERVEGGPARVTSEPRTYDRHRPQRSFFLDMARASVNNDHQAAERLRRHREEVAVDVAAMETDQRRGFERWLNTDGEGGSAERRDIDRVDGTGGDFVPPIWLLEEYAEFARAGRPFANAVRQVPLPQGTDSINVPKILTGSATAPQTADNAAVQETDLTTGVAVAPVRTIAGQQDVALQLLEQSPIAFDEVVFADLIGALNANVDQQVIAGSGAAGQLKGVLAATGITTVTYTDASPTVAELYAKLADAINQAGTNRKLPPSVVLMHLRRWMWEASALDSNSRPLVVPLTPVSHGPNNALAIQQALETGGIVGNQLGINTMVDLNVPINLGAGTNEDRIIVTRASDHILFEGTLRTRVLPEVLSGTLTVRLQVYEYAAFTAERFPAGISVIAGTGLVTPTF